jgi:ABC-type bacteriocin/lantibiotic exporter with double-glycine peptidase domain
MLSPDNLESILSKSVTFKMYNRGLRSYLMIHANTCIDKTLKKKFIWHILNKSSSAINN